MHELEVWVLVDENGDYVASHDADALADLYEEAIGGNAGVARRLVKVALKVPEFRPIEVSGTVPEVATEGTELYAE